MADDREPYEPLWARGLAAPPQPAPDPTYPEPAPIAPRDSGRFAAVATAGFGILLVCWYAAIMSAISSELTIGEVPSAWESVPMTCAIVRLEDRDGTLEVFRCRALPSALEELPAGFYTAPGTLWRSDIDRRAALDHVITISPSGELTGRAIYAP